MAFHAAILMLMGGGVLVYSPTSIMCGTGHGDAARRSGCPKSRCGAIRRGNAAYGEYFIVKNRADRAVVELTHGLCGMTSAQVEQQCSLQGAMYDQAGVTFFFAAVIDIVVDAVRVED